MKKVVFAILGIVGVFVAVHIIAVHPEAGLKAKYATLLGGIAYILLAVSIFLSTRPRFLETFFGGLDRIYVVHKFCGIFALILIFAHFFLVPKEIPAEFSNLGLNIVPSAPLGMISLVLLTLSLFLALNRKIPYSRWRKMHRPMGFIFIFITVHFFTAPYVLFDKFGASGLILLAVGTLGIASYIYSFFGFNSKPKNYFIVEGVNKLERATEVVMKPKTKGKDGFDFKPGQFAFIEVQEKDLKEFHPFTISSSPDEDNLRFTIKVLGDWTRKIRDQLKKGAEVVVVGPYGCFSSDIDSKNQVWLAGGAGITPFLSILRDMKKGDDRKVTLVYAVREKKEALFLDEIKAKADLLGNVKLILLESNKGEFADEDFIKNRLSNLQSSDFFLCGPAPMVVGLSKTLKAQGVAKSRLHKEAFDIR